MKKLIAIGLLALSLLIPSVGSFAEDYGNVTVLGDFITKDPYVDVRAYGAVGDGITDDTTAITAAISAGTRIFFPAGEYLVPNGITLTTDKIFFGEGAKTSQLTITSATANGVTLDNNAGRCQILGMKIYSSNASTGAGVSGITVAIREFKIDDYEIEGFLIGIKILSGLNPFIGQGRLIGQGYTVAGGEGIHFGDFATSISVNLGVIQNCYAAAYKTGVNFDCGNDNIILGGALEGMDICIRNQGYNSCYTSWLSANTYFLQQATGGYSFTLGNPSGLFNYAGSRIETPIESGYIDFGSADSQIRTLILSPKENYIPNQIKILVDSATPSVKGGNYFSTNGTTTITNFADGVTGQVITINSYNTVTITDGTNIFLSGSANWTMANTDSLTLIQRIDGKWYELCRSVAGSNIYIGNVSGTASNLSGTPALPNGTTATTQAAGSNDTKIATDAYADAKVADAITDGVTTIAPSENAVFDALALKSPIASPNFTGVVGIGMTGAEPLSAKGTSGDIARLYTTDGGTEASLVFSPAVSTSNSARIQGIDNSGNAELSFKTGGLVRLKIASNGIHTMSVYGAGAATFDASGNISSASDERLKNIQGKLKYGLKEVLQINPILYKWNEKSGLETEHIYTGFSAQEIQKLIPETVGENKDGYLSLSDRGIEGALVNSIKELNAKIEKLEKKIVALEKN
jgi:hypothetical protein